MSCLFDSMSYFFKINSMELRQIICNYLERNEPIIDGLETKTILDLEDTNYIQKMRNPACWGGGNEIRAACNIWSAKIIVYLDQKFETKIEFIPLNSECNGYIELLWYGDHYEPVVIRK